MDKVAVLIPCYNESLTVSKVVNDFKAQLPDAKIYVYDNNSTDDTSKLAEQAGAIVKHEHRQGKGNVVRAMFQDIDAECYILVDGDDTYSADNVHEMVRLVCEDGIDMVVGDRLSTTYFKENKRRFHNTGNVFVRWLVNTMFKSKIKDVMSGYRALSYLFVKSYPITVTGFELETDMTVFALDKNLTVKTIPVDYVDRPHGSTSKLRTVSDGTKVLRTIFSLCKNYRPLFFFGLLSALLLGAGGGLFIYPVLYFYFKTGLVTRIPTLIAALFLIMIGIMSLVCGLILETVAANDRKSYELHFKMVKNNCRKTGTGGA